MTATVTLERQAVSDTDKSLGTVTRYTLVVDGTEVGTVEQMRDPSPSGLGYGSKVGWYLSVKNPSTSMYGDTRTHVMAQFERWLSHGKACVGGCGQILFGERVSYMCDACKEALTATAGIRELTHTPYGSPRCTSCGAALNADENVTQCFQCRRYEGKAHGMERFEYPRVLRESVRKSRERWAEHVKRVKAEHAEEPALRAKAVGTYRGFEGRVITVEQRQDGTLQVAVAGKARVATMKPSAVLRLEAEGFWVREAAPQPTCAVCAAAFTPDLNAAYVDGRPICPGCDPLHPSHWVASILALPEWSEGIYCSQCGDCCTLEGGDWDDACQYVIGPGAFCKRCWAVARGIQALWDWHRDHGACECCGEEAERVKLEASRCCYSCVDSVYSFAPGATRHAAYQLPSNLGWEVPQPRTLAQEVAQYTAGQAIDFGFGPAEAAIYDEVASRNDRGLALALEDAGPTPQQELDWAIHNDHADDPSRDEWEAEAYAAQYDDDPSPYNGNYSEE